ncbi:phospholipase D-like domain-containing protein [Uliginosibacterium gangwonense]|uniref:phospholipase D-like domain-containing protein n=1 Tax=Uliginosibacterium gangwonense TaxID=392736 RepID=UPI000374F7AE|nr:phospholipase D-like domain-containing protein [Uliginosibacterium gangwonense]
MSDVDTLKTQRSETVHLGLNTGIAYGSSQWLLENSLTHPVRTGNTLEIFICGQEGFNHIATDIENAKGSIDLVCWGFDPAMAIKREINDPKYLWARGEPYGELLKRKAQSGVKVRLLVWYADRGSATQNSLVGYVEPGASLTGAVIHETWDEQQHSRIESDVRFQNADSIMTSNDMAAETEQRYKHAHDAKPLTAQRQDYCTYWWREATSGQIPNLEVRCRSGNSQKVKASVADEADKPQSVSGTHLGIVNEKMLIEGQATHHQKPVLIDYDHDNGVHAVGYIMGLNSVSGYWDTDQHAWDEPLRESDLDGSSDAIAGEALKKGISISLRPLQDYASRIQGAALQDVYTNFATAWNRAQLLPKLKGPNNAKSNAVRGDNLDEALCPPALAKTEAEARSLRIQVLRTQPEEAYKDAKQSWPFDKSIKHAYFQASSFARSYLYLENQYFFYEEWARHLKANRGAFMNWIEDAGKQSQDARLLHLLVVIPAPENDGMLPRTYDTLKSLGQADSLPNQNKRVTDENASRWTRNSAITNTAIKVTEPSLNREGVLLQDGKSLGLKVLIMKMVTQNKGGTNDLERFRDIYIHSKMMMTDDCFVTLGSANLNLRSMSADSEINMATDSTSHCQKFRERVWKQMTGEKYGGKDGTPEEIADTFLKWEKLSKKNKDAMTDDSNFHGFIVKFEDKRTSTYRYG